MPQATEPLKPREEFGDSLVRSFKLMGAVKQRSPRLHPKVDPIGYPLLFNLRDEPRRVSEIAERVHLDISTVSRQVTTLVGQGLVAKVADPSDGRAQMLTLTDEGRQMLIEVRARRNAWLAEVVDGWSDADLATFDSLLTRFADDVEAHPLFAPKDLA
ncbi:putative marR-family transcriptional regulator [Janibacter sp. HTCC2649]|uniref:MarR family winged helix-turn-helix transcriptional regulator n=1 Tax=Janibacter sp. HTCC2649 TaxID=313589 RepID=UPI00006708B4|nr:MarR family transcriptional regulator [Janibacter sp. HTCC2649]EAQ00812.1 putative marR-family transcriptional regulator [Janibacter sp. HTCC2649]